MKCKSCGGEVANEKCKGCGFPTKKTTVGEIEVSTMPVETDENFLRRMKVASDAFKMPEGEVLIGKK